MRTCSSESDFNAFMQRRPVSFLHPLDKLLLLQNVKQERILVHMLTSNFAMVHQERSLSLLPSQFRRQSSYPPVLLVTVAYILFLHACCCV